MHAGGGTVEQLAQTVSAGSMASRVYAVGAGQDAGPGVDLFWEPGPGPTDLGG